LSFSFLVHNLETSLHTVEALRDLRASLNSRKAVSLISRFLKIR